MTKYIGCANVVTKEIQLENEFLDHGQLHLKDLSTRPSECLSVKKFKGNPLQAISNL